MNAARFVASSPATRAGSAMPQWAMIGWPGKIGHDSFARSHTVTTKSQGSRSNPSMLRGARPRHGVWYSRSVSIA